MAILIEVVGRGSPPPLAVNTTPAGREGLEEQCLF